jgi:uncharacterized Fe-S cluster-containing MiaB family protein
MAMSFILCSGKRRRRIKGISFLRRVTMDARKVTGFYKALVVVSLFTIGCLAVFSTGCSSVGYLVGGAPTTFQGNYEIEIEKPHTNILNVITEVGKSMGYRVSALNVKGKCETGMEGY